MVLLLLRDVLRYRLHIRRAYLKGSIAALPMEIHQGSVLCLDPLGITRLDLLDNFRQRAILREAKNRMNVVTRAANLDGGGILIFQDSRQICVYLPSQV